jgi:ferritin-like metal-binding protein YciE
MDASPEVLAETVRAKRVAIDNDLELLRVRLQNADPRRIDIGTWAKRLLPVAGGTAALWLWTRRRRRVDSLEQLLVHGLTDLYHAEHQLVPALDRMRVQATNVELEKALDHHRYETEGHIERLERVFRSVGAKPKRGSSAAIAAIVTDGERLLARKVDRDVRDAWLIATAQRIEHLEIANYGTVRTYAETLGFTFAAQLLQQTLEEERMADEKLTHLAERFVNPQSIRASHPRRSRS